MPNRFCGNDFQSQTIPKYPTLRPLCGQNPQEDIIIQSQTTSISKRIKPIKPTPPLFIYKVKDLTTIYQASITTVEQAAHKNHLDLKINGVPLNITVHQIQSCLQKDQRFITLTQYQLHL